MSVQALTWAYEQQVGSASTKLILVTLANFANLVGEVYPSLAYLIEVTELNRKTVIGAIDKLEALGLLVDTGERRGSTKQVKVYRLAVNQIADSPKNGTVSTPETVPILDGNSSVFSAKSPVFTSKESQKRNPEPSRNLQDTKGTRLPEDWQPDEVAIEFCRSLNLDPNRVVPEFKDYWISVPGARGRKLDWSRTFRNRCRELQGRPAYRSQQYQAPQQAKWNL